MPSMLSKLREHSHNDEMAFLRTSSPFVQSMVGELMEALHGLEKVSRKTILRASARSLSLPRQHKQYQHAMNMYIGTLSHFMMRLQHTHLMITNNLRAVNAVYDSNGSIDDDYETKSSAIAKQRSFSAALQGKGIAHYFDSTEKETLKLFNMVRNYVTHSLATEVFMELEKADFGELFDILSRLKDIDFDIHDELVLSA